LTDPARPLRVAVADDGPAALAHFRQLLARLGHQVVAAASTGRELVDGCCQAEPDLVITDVKMPDVDGIAAAEEINRHRPTPVVLLSPDDDPQSLARAEAAGPVMAYLVKPVKPPDLAAAVRLAVARFGEHQAARQALEDRKLVERAKGAVVKRLGVGEDIAYRRLRRYASDHNLKLAEVAARVLRAEEVFRRVEGADRPTG
jgi:two-component system, response regulator PdtaR